MQPAQVCSIASAAIGLTRAQQMEGAAPELRTNWGSTNERVRREAVALALLGQTLAQHRSLHKRGSGWLRFDPPALKSGHAARGVLDLGAAMATPVPFRRDSVQAYARLASGLRIGPGGAGLRLDFGSWCAARLVWRTGWFTGWLCAAWPRTGSGPPRCSRCWWRWAKMYLPSRWGAGRFEPDRGATGGTSLTHEEPRDIAPQTKCERTPDRHERVGSTRKYPHSTSTTHPPNCMWSRATPVRKMQPAGILTTP